MRQADSLAVFPPNDLRFGICLSAQGQRFLNEDVYFGRLGEYALLHQDGHVYLLVDDERFGRPENFEVELAAVGETIEEVEAELGMPTGALVQTVAFYNEHAAKGEDPLFNKGADWLAPIVKPPFGVLDLKLPGSRHVLSSPVRAAFTESLFYQSVRNYIYRP